MLGSQPSRVTASSWIAQIFDHMAVSTEGLELRSFEVALTAFGIGVARKFSFNAPILSRHSQKMIDLKKNGKLGMEPSHTGTLWWHLSGHADMQRRTLANGSEKK